MPMPYRLKFCTCKNDVYANKETVEKQHRDVHDRANWYLGVRTNHCLFSQILISTQPTTTTLGHQGEVTMTSSAQSILDSHVLVGPFEGMSVAEGAVPSWLSGTLVRTGLGVFRHGSWQAEHLFDALGALYSFQFRPSGQIKWALKLLDCETNRAALEGKSPRLTFGTKVKRSAVQRLFEPIALTTDNANVNVQKFGADWIAMTETPHQFVVDPENLCVLSKVIYTDNLPSSTSMIAHPQYDATRKEVVSLGLQYGMRSQILVYSHDLMSRQRKIIGRLSLSRIPYIHSFALTPTKAIIILHPFDMNALSIPWSNKGLVEHFSWKPSAGTRIALVDRVSGEVTYHECGSFFTFHVANAYDEKSDTVLDLLAYNDSSIAHPLTKMAVLEHGFPDLAPTLTRIRMTNGTKAAKMETLTSKAGFEFPSINYRLKNMQKHRFVWGSEGKMSSAGYKVTVIKSDVENGDVSRYDDGIIYSEPIFVGRPGSAAEDDGVLLVVGKDLVENRSQLSILHAASLELLAKVKLPIALPFGFHGGFSFT
jgi:carotenoid cleavage dioxygenase-like enzyme